MQTLWHLVGAETNKLVQIRLVSGWCNGGSKKTQNAQKIAAKKLVYCSESSKCAYVVDLHIVAVKEGLDEILNVERTVHPGAFKTALRVERNASSMWRCTLAIQCFFAAVRLSFFRLHGGVFRVHQIAQIFVVHGDCGTPRVCIHTLHANTFLSRAL
jgi:hypothetical protein